MRRRAMQSKVQAFCLEVQESPPWLALQAQQPDFPGLSRGVLKEMKSLLDDVKVQTPLP
jgi:hypothetical protein